jgi:hypothetical protein
MMPTVVKEQAPVPPPSYQRAQARLRRALHIDALTLVTTLHLLALCRLAVRLAHRRCPPPLPAGKGGARRTSSEESLLLKLSDDDSSELVISSLRVLLERILSFPPATIYSGLSQPTRLTQA